MVGEGRVYGGGLYKMEPKELGNIPAKAVLEAIPGVSLKNEMQMRLFEE
jgi:adenine-specific DNA-methyltransferase